MNYLYQLQNLIHDIFAASLFATYVLF